MEVVAWRGASWSCLENTAEAVAAVPPWVTRVEIDTRLTSDGVMVAFHSPTMGVHGDYRDVSSISYEEISEKKLLYRKALYRIPRVSELVDLFRDKEFILHVKREANVTKYMEAVERLPRPCCFHSNSERHLNELRGLTMVKKLYKSVYQVPSETLHSIDGYFCGHKAFMPVSSLEDWWLAELRHAGKEIIVFAGSAEEWMEEVLEHDVDAFLTGRFDRAEAVLRRAGKWLD